LRFSQVRCKHFTNFHYKIAENTVIFQSCLHFCQWYSSIFEQELSHSHWHICSTSLSMKCCIQRVSFKGWNRVKNWWHVRCVVEGWVQQHLTSKFCYYLNGACVWPVVAIKDPHFWHYFYEISLVDLTVVHLGNNFANFIIPKYCSHYFPAHIALL